MPDLPIYYKKVFTGASKRSQSQGARQTRRQNRAVLPSCLTFLHGHRPPKATKAGDRSGEDNKNRRALPHSEQAISGAQPPSRTPTNSGVQTENASPSPLRTRHGERKPLRETRAPSVPEICGNLTRISSTRAHQGAWGSGPPALSHLLAFKGVFRLRSEDNAFKFDKPNSKPQPYVTFEA